MFLRNYVDLFPQTSKAADIQTDVSSHVETVCLLSKLSEAKKEDYEQQYNMYLAKYCS